MPEGPSDPRPTRARPHPESLAVGALITALVAIGQISTSIYIPSLPSLVGALQTDAVRVNLSFSAFLFGFAVFQLVYGPLSDRFGRRPVLLVGLAFYIAASAACAFAPTIEALIVGRAVQGMAACSGVVLGRAVVRDIYGPVRSAKAMAYVGVAMAISPAVAPIIGGYLQVWFGWRANFAFLAGVGAVMWLAAWRTLDETNRHRDPQATRIGGLIRAYGTLLASPSYHGHMWAVAFVFAGLMAFASGSPFVFIDLLGLSPERFGMLAVFTVVGFLVGSLAAGRLTPRLGIGRMMVAGLGLCVVGGGAMAAIAGAGRLDVVAIIAPFTVYAAGMAIVFANGIAGAMAPYARIAGAASALLGFVQMTVGGLGAVAVGAVAATSQMPMSAVIAVAAAAALVAYLTLARPGADRRAR